MSYSIYMDLRSSLDIDQVRLLLKSESERYFSLLRRTPVQCSVVTMQDEHAILVTSRQFGFTPNYLVSVVIRDEWESTEDWLGAAVICANLVYATCGDGLLVTQNCEPIFVIIGSLMQINSNISSAHELSLRYPQAKVTHIEL